MFSSQVAHDSSPDNGLRKNKNRTCHCFSFSIGCCYFHITNMVIQAKRCSIRRFFECHKGSNHQCVYDHTLCCILGRAPLEEKCTRQLNHHTDSYLIHGHSNVFPIVQLSLYFISFSAWCLEEFREKLFSMLNSLFVNFPLQPASLAEMGKTCKIQLVTQVSTVLTDLKREYSSIPLTQYGVYLFC